MSPAYRTVHGERPTLRPLHRLLPLLLIAILFIAPVVPAIAQDINLLYSENFDDGTADGWTLPSTVEGAWWVENGRLTGFGHVLAEFPGVEWGSGPHTLNFDFGPLGVGNGFHVNLHHSDLGRYYVGFRQVNESELFIYLKRNLWGQPSQELASTAGNNFPYNDAVNYHVSIDFGDGQFIVALIKQGQESTSGYQTVISALDPQPLPPGGISFESLENMQVRLDNLEVYGPGLPVAFPAWTQPPVAEPPQQTEPPAPPPQPPAPPPQPPAPPPQPPEQPSAPVPGFRQCDSESLLYSEGFEDALAQDWQLESGWSVHSGLMEGKGHFWANYRAGNWQDLTLYVVFSHPPNGGGMHINLRMSETGRYFVSVHSGGIGLHKHLWQFQNVSPTDLATQQLGIDPAVWHTLAFGVHGKELQVSLDGVLYLQATDDQPLPPGSIAFESVEDPPVQIEEVWVCGTPAAVKTQPPAPPPAPKPPSSQPLPDLRINAIEAGKFDPSTRIQLLRITVINQGDGTAASNRLRVVQQGGGSETFYPLTSLFPGQTTAIQARLNIPSSLLGRSARFEVEVDPDKRIQERNERNNIQLSSLVNFPAPPPEFRLPDLRITAIQAQEFDSSARTQLLQITVINLGDETAALNRLRVRQQGGEAETSSPLISLLPGQTTDLLVSLSVPPSLLGRSARYEVQLDPDNRILEINELNNRQLSDPIQFPKSGLEIDWTPIIGVIVGVTIVLLIGRWVWRRLRRPRAPDRPGKEPQPLPPILPPLRLLDLWLTEGGSGKGPRLKDDRLLVAGSEYCLHAQIVSREAQPRGRSRSKATQSPVPLQAVIFSPSTDFAVRNRRIGLNLLPAGSSEPIFWPFRASEPGLRRARVCLYYGNLLLQSAFVDAQVVTRKSSGRASATGALRRMLDYVSSASLSGLEGIPQPSVSIFANHTVSGAGWIGVYAAGDPLTGFADGLLRQVDPDRLTARAGPVRQHLLEIEEAYNYSQASPAGEAWARQLSRLEQDLAALACSGWTLYHELFLQSPGVAKQDKTRFDQALRPPGLVAIDRCRSERTTLPWAAIYDLEVDTGKQDLLRLCPVFKAELEAHWSENPGQYSPHHDWLDNPQGCQINPRCPLASQDEEQTILTICPFGFWGFRHQISQPLQTVQPTPVGQIPEEIARHGEDGGNSSFDSTIFLRRRQDERLKLAIGVHPGLSQANQLPVDITALRPGELEVTFDSTRDGVLGLLKQGGFHLYILYCHGDRDEREQKFKLVFGPLQDERPISCENLNPLKISWPEQPKPLVMLNGCETVAVTPEMVHGLLDRLHELGAAGVVGTEIQVYPSLAYPFGLEILERLLCGASVGEAFLEERKELLRKFNPLGLAYTYYSAAALHLHVEGACSWCAAHQVQPN